MRIFLDFEFFENGRTIAPISVGLIGDGRSMYREFCGAGELANATPWLSEHVAPHLSLKETKSADVIAREIVDFVGEAPEFWGYFCSYDWVLLCQLYGPMIALPQGWPMRCRDVEQMRVALNERRDGLGLPPIVLPQQKHGHHNALADALWAKSSHRYLLGR